MGTSQFESDVVLKDGSLVHLRPVRVEDRSLLADFVKRLSDETLALRYLTGAVDREKVVDAMLPGPGRFTLLATREGRVIAHAAYHAISPEKAEPSVMVAEEYRRKGLGTILLGQLAEAAYKAGIMVFEATIAPENHPIIGLLRKLGYQALVKVESGLIRVAFPTSIIPEAIEFFERREASAAVAAVEKFLRPKSVAVIGASRDRESIGGRLFWNLIESGFRGPVYPVNRNADVVQGVPAYRSVLDCPGPIDLAIIAVPAPAVIPVAKECARKGVPALVVISAGFAESGAEGARLQQELVEICREAGMRLIGPNCMGLVNTHPEVSLNAQFSSLKPKPGTVGFLSQSGALGLVIFDQSNRLGLGMSSFISVGNKADISGNDLIQYWEVDDNTDVILLYLESFGNPRKFTRIARRVARKKPIVAVKSGRSPAGVRAAQSHTGALVAASDITVDALFHQSGVIRTDTVSEMFDVAALLVTQPLPKGDRVAIITNGGGVGVMAADAFEGFGLKVPELSHETQAALRILLPKGAGVTNPVDMTAAATAEDYARAIGIVKDDPNVDAIVVISLPPVAVSPEDVAKAILAAARELEGRLPIISIFMASHGIPPLLSDGSIRIPSYPFPESAARALAKAVQYARWLTTPEGKATKFPGLRREEAAAIVARALSRGGGWLSQEEMEALLGCYGIELLTTIKASTPEEAGRAAAKLGGAVVLKGIVPGVVHKTDVGAVRLGLTGEEDVRTAAQEMLEHLASKGLKATGFLIQPMVQGGVEMFLGVTHDPIFGPVVACGAGGVLVELLKDVTVRITPLTDRDASEMVRSLKTYPLLAGYRGGPRHDIAALEETILRLGALAEDIPEIAELDLNPVMVLPERGGVSIVDARIRVAEALPPLPLGAKKR